MMDTMKRAALTDNSTVIIIDFHSATQFVTYSIHFLFISKNFISFLQYLTTSSRKFQFMWKCPVLLAAFSVSALFLILLICFMKYPWERVAESLSLCCISICGLVLTTHSSIQRNTNRNYFHRLMVNATCLTWLACKAESRQITVIFVCFLACDVTIFHTIFLRPNITILTIAIL